MNDVRWMIRNNYQNELNVLRQAQAYHVDDNYVFTHSGGRAGVPLREQTIVDIVESRDFKKRDKLHVVGHTPKENVKFNKDKNILFCDVGCVFIKERELPMILLAKQPDEYGELNMYWDEELDKVK